ncbi:MAG: hypothetical protein NC489_44235 [Ruminococcus flavefaciens]|nr:hypothetical protein [Ruminococcus flavefaciens]
MDRDTLSSIRNQAISLHEIAVVHNSNLEMLSLCHSLKALTNVAKQHKTLHYLSNCKSGLSLYEYRKNFLFFSKVCLNFLN